MRHRKIPPAIAAVAPDGQLTPAQRRRFLIDLCLRRIRPGTGRGTEFLQTRTAANLWPDLRPILKGIPWVIAGAVATRAYMPERMTGALDILVRCSDGDLARELLEAAGYRFVSRLAVPGYLVRSPEGVEVDVTLSEHPWLDHALSQPRWDEAGYPVLGLPYLVLIKIAASRSQDVADITRMLGLASDKELDRVRAAVANHAPDAIDDLESMIYLSQVEMGKQPAPND